MSPPRPLAPPRDLTIPEPGSMTARDVLSSSIRRLLGEIRPLVRDHASLAPPGDVAAFDRLLVTLLRDHPAPLVSVLRRPNVGALIRTLRRPREESDADILCELIGHVTLELAVIGELPFEVSLLRFPRRVLSLAGAFALDVPADVDEVVLRSGWLRARSGAQALEVDLGGAARGDDGRSPSSAVVRRPYLPIDGGIVLAQLENNPLALVEAHPDKLGNAVDLGGTDAPVWVDTLRRAFALVETYLPDVRAEMELYLSQIVPVGVDATRHLSASYREAIGTIYMTLHPNLMTMTEALIHEFQHNKLNALFELDDVLVNAFSPLFHSPVRPDPRPLHGVLLAVHAFLPVARLYEQMRARGDAIASHESFGKRFDQIVGINREGAEVVLQNGVATPVGKGLLDEIQRWDEHYRCGK